MSNANNPTSGRAARDIGLQALSTDELRRLARAVDAELETRNLEANLKRELAWHQRRRP